jgi:hypothetical protein
MRERHDIIRMRLVNIDGEGLAARVSTGDGTKKER